MSQDSNVITREYFDSLLIEMRHIDSVKPKSKVKLFGASFSTPIATAALSHLNRNCADGMTKLAEGARMAGALCFSGMGEPQEIADMCATGAKVIKIIKPHADNGDIFREIKEAEEAGAFGVGMDIDHAFGSNGDYDSVCGLDMRPKSLDELKQFIASTRLPFIVKGVLSVSDANKALEAGAAGIVVSHHHGIIDFAVPPVMMLPDIKTAVGDKMTVFADCCIESGMDAFKAIAMGADAVCVGRALMPPLKENGAQGVCFKLLEIDSQLRGVMARTGFGRVEMINSSVIHKRDF